jgi:hypothetical protein
MMKDVFARDAEIHASLLCEFALRVCFASLLCEFALRVCFVLVIKLQGNESFLHIIF